MQLDAILEHSAARFPDKVALVCADQRWSYGELDAAANSLARSLLDRGVRRGDRVVILLENSYEAVVSIFAALKLGGVFVVVNPTTKTDKLGYLLRDSGAACLVSDGRRWSVIEPCLEEATDLRSVVLAPGGRDGIEHSALDWFDDLVTSSTADPLPQAAIDIDLAALIYTSGSTGRPKGVMMTHRSMVAAATSITTYLRNTPDDVILDALPLSFDYGLYQVLMAFLVGARVVLERSFAYPGSILSRIRDENVTGFPVVPTIVSLLSRLVCADSVSDSLRYITNTGAALSQQHIRELQRMFPGVEIFSMYGLTECKRVSYLPPEELGKRPLSVGRAMPNVEVFIVDEEGRAVPPGTTGELVVRGSNVMQGYWGLDAETARVLRPGPTPGERLLFTGDLFRMDDDGFLYFVSRQDDIIKTRGEKVSPKEVEVALLGLDGVAEAAVVGVEDAILGEAVAAYVRLAPGAELTESDILRHCSDRLETFMVPKRVVICPELPLTDSGKIDKQRLARS